MNFINCTALVTGAASGIGRAAALKLLECGARVIFVYRDPTGREASAKNLVDTRALAAPYGSRAIFMQADVTDEGQVSALFERIQAEVGALDHVANIAGANVFDSIDGMDMAKLHEVFEINFFSKALVIKYALPLLKKSSCPAIVNIASRMAVKPAPMGSGYCAAEAATIMFTKSCALELAPFGIRANSVSPGRTIEPERELDERLRAYADQNPCGRVGWTTDVANAVAFLLSDEAAHINGSDLAVNGGILLV